jgi:predicted nucleotidyltransferase
VSADGRFTAALRALTAALDELDAPSMIIGGIAVIAAGVPRETIDIDATVLGRAVTLDKTVAALLRHGIRPRIDDALQFARERQVLLLQHNASGVTIELSFAWFPFEEEALSRALETTVESVSVRLARPEDLIVYKAAAWRDRDRADIERLLILYVDRIDLKRVRGLIDQISAALEDPNRVQLFDEMVERARRSR